MAVEIESALTFSSDLSADEFLGNAAASLAFRVAIAESAGVPVSAVEILRAAAKSSQRRALRQTSRFELEIDYAIRLELRGIVGDSSDLAEAAVSTVLEKLSTAITSGTYATTLTASLAASNADVDLGTLDPISNAAAVNAATITMAMETPQPTSAPTPSPSQPAQPGEPNGVGHDDDDFDDLLRNLKTMLIVAISLLLLVVSLQVFSLVVPRSSRSISCGEKRLWSKQGAPIHVADSNFGPGDEAKNSNPHLRDPMLVGPCA